MGDSLSFVEESMHQKTRKSHRPIHRVKFSDPNMHFRNNFMEKANIWLKKKRHDSLKKRRAMSSSRQSSLTDEDVLKISKMPSLPATDAALFNKGWYKKDVEEGLIPLPSIFSNRGSKSLFEGEKVDVEGEMSKRKKDSLSLNGVRLNEHGTVSDNALMFNTFLGGDGNLSASAASGGMVSVEHNTHTVEDLHNCKEHSKILYFGNMECRQNMEDSFAFFEKFNDGNYEEASSFGEKEDITALEGNFEILERNNYNLGDNLERITDECAMNVDGICGKGESLI
ncbi:hypothetical protein L6452_43392 [Arctium lappa]|uniref:Uncharacterized protein n=1 Tax=Arctium lappa TaxID=4217 RepID=A0ACB8XCA9_ARCLA|nr:hypothetical protein L6452_43392 [Arctium lappa]